MTKIGAYALAHRRYVDARTRRMQANVEETEALVKLRDAWLDVKSTLPPGVYSTEGGKVVVVGTQECPDPMQVMEEHEMHPCGKCRKSAGACRCERKTLREPKGLTGEL